MKILVSDAKIVEVLKDYATNDDTADVIAQRHGVRANNVTAWAKRAGLKVAKRHRNWGLIGQLVKAEMAK
jgi:hypothetical protein